MNGGALIPEQDRPSDQVEEFGPLPHAPSLIPSVEHQDHCSFFEERGCDCEPEVVFLELPSLEETGDQDVGLKLLPNIAMKGGHGRSEG